MLIESVTVGNGKYTITNDNGRLTALRNGEPWDRDLVGDNLVYWMMIRIQELEAAVSDSSSRYAASAEEYLRSRYGAYKAHHEWRSLEESFIAGAIHSSRAVAEAAVKDAGGGEVVAFISASKFEQLQQGSSVVTTLTSHMAFKDDIALYTRPQASAAVPEEAHRVIKLLVECARMAFFALDDSEERVGEDGREHVIDANNFDALCNTLDALEELPDHDDETVIFTGPLKAEYLLRKLLATSQPEVKP